jgi:hypothetical protein
LGKAYTHPTGTAAQYKSSETQQRLHGPAYKTNMEHSILCITLSINHTTIMGHGVTKGRKQKQHKGQSCITPSQNSGKYKWPKYDQINITSLK